MCVSSPCPLLRTPLNLSFGRFVKKSYRGRSLLYIKSRWETLYNIVLLIHVPKIHKSRKLWNYCHSWIFRRGRGRGSKNGFDKGLGVQVGSSTAEDASKPTSEKLKAGGQDLLGKFVEEQLKNIKITNVEEQLKTDPKITKVNNSCGQVVRNFEREAKTRCNIFFPIS